MLTGGAGNENYSHWLFDVLPRLSLCNEVFELSKIDFFLLPDLSKNFQKETLETIGIKIDKCLSSRLFRTYISKRNNNNRPSVWHYERCYIRHSEYACMDI